MSVCLSVCLSVWRGGGGKWGSPLSCHGLTSQGSECFESEVHLLTRGRFPALIWVAKGAYKQTHRFVLSQITYSTLPLPRQEKRNSGNAVPVEVSFTSDF